MFFAFWNALAGWATAAASGAYTGANDFSPAGRLLLIWDLRSRRLVKDKLRIQQIQRILLLVRAIVHEIANRRLCRIVKVEARFPALFHPGSEHIGKIRIQCLQYRHSHFLEGCRITELFVLSPDRDDQQLLAQVKRLGGGFETRTGEDGLTGDKTLIKGTLADGKEKDIPILNGLFYLPGKDLEAKIP